MKGPTQQYSDTIKSLQSRIQALEDENRLLKERLEEAGVSYANIVSGDAEGVVELYDPDQGARIKKFDVTDKIASDFFMMFCRGRKDVYDLRYTNPKTGKNGYYSQCFNRWDRGCHIQKKDGVRCKDCELRAYKPVTLPLIKAHMNGTDPNGNDVVAIYPMLENNLCQLLVFDFDNHAKGAEQEDYANIDDGWKEEINALRRICKNLDVDAVVERSRSGRGAHLWIFFKEMVPARLARRFGFALLEKGAESVKEHRELVSRNTSICFDESRMEEWTFENADMSDAVMHKAKSYVDNWEEMKRNHIGCLFWGPVGTGKSFIAGCIANELLKQEVTVKMTNFNTIIDDIFPLADKMEYINALASYQLLIIDDLGVERNSEYALGIIFSVIDRRIRSGRPLIITTNLPLIEIKSETMLDKRRIYDRILEMCTPMYVGGTSKREVIASMKMEKAKTLLNTNRGKEECE